MATAFQASAFQNNAFQIDDPVVGRRGGATYIPGLKREREKREQKEREVAQAIERTIVQSYEQAIKPKPKPVPKPKPIDLEADDEYTITQLLMALED
jgi:hypothetical protein